MSAKQRRRIDVKTIFGSKFGSRLAAVALGFAVVLGVTTLAMPAIAQTPATAPASIHGVVRNPAGFVLKTGDVKFSLTVAGAKPADP